MPKLIMDDERKSLEPYAWPGGYPIMYLAKDGWRDDETGKLEANPHDNTESVCCAKCAADVTEWPDIIIIDSFIHYEGPPEYCEWCNSLTPSAYGDPDEPDDTTRGVV